jgi:hypothetical protein
MLKDCSCGGLNENCYRCFGRGYYNVNEIASDFLHNISNRKPRNKASKLCLLPKKRHNVLIAGLL